jgi:hypothetical protein
MKSVVHYVWKISVWSIGNITGYPFGPKGEEVVGGWRKLHNEELHNLHATRNKIRVMEVKEDEMG